MSATVLAGVMLAGCSAQPVPSGTSPTTSSTPGGVVSAEPDDGGADVGTNTITVNSACELAAQSAALEELGAVGAPADVSLVVELSMCTLEIDVPDQEPSSFGLSILTSDDIALTAGADPESIGGTIVPLPGLGENGHFVARGVGIDPRNDPMQGAILSARGDLGVSLSWAMASPSIPFATFEQAVREILDALGG